MSDPIDRSVSLRQLSQQTPDDAPPTCTAVYRSGLLDVTADELRAAIAWPTIA